MTARDRRVTRTPGAGNGAGRPRRTRRRLPGGAALAALLLSTVPGCEGATEPHVGRVEMVPPSVYGEWWDEVEACSGLTGDFTGVRWFLAYELGGGDHILGQWNGRREITLRIDVWLDRGVVEHEMLHDLLRGDGDHRRPEWAACGIDTGLPEGE